MSSIFKEFNRNEIVSTKTLINEAIPVTGTIISGTYSDENIKNYSHGMFQTVYDYPYLSSSANAIFDISFGYSANSALNDDVASVQNSKKLNLYSQMAQVLVGHDVDGTILEFDEDGDFSGTGGTKMREVVFVNLKRLLKKDEIKKQTTYLSFYTGGTTTGSAGLDNVITLHDVQGSTDFRVNSPSGEYGFLSASGGDAGLFPGNVGLIYYQAGIMVLTASLFSSVNIIDFGSPSDAVAGTIEDALIDLTIQQCCDGLRARWDNFTTQNVIEINSTFYNVSIDSNEFNYSSNPTYLSGSRIVNKEVTQDQPSSYITTVGLYSADNVLLGVAKLSEPIKKTPSAPLNIRVRTDF